MEVTALQNENQQLRDGLSQGADALSAKEQALCREREVVSEKDQRIAQLEELLRSKRSFQDVLPGSAFDP